MSASLVGSEMCIRDRLIPAWAPPALKSSRFGSHPHPASLAARLATPWAVARADGRPHGRSAREPQQREHSASGCIEQRKA
eukprot:14516922-Alexandrium_andersonii.AAC.1